MSLIKNRINNQHAQCKAAAEAQAKIIAQQQAAAEAQAKIIAQQQAEIAAQAKIIAQQQAEIAALRKAKIAAEAKIAENQQAQIAAKPQAKIAAHPQANIAAGAQYTKAIVFSTKEARAYAAKTLRYATRFGGNNETGGYYFVWPKQQDILSWPLDKPTTVSSIDCQTWTEEYGRGIFSIQVHLSNGVSSPLFKGWDEPTSGIKTVHLSDAPSIRRIQGTKIDTSIRELNFKRADSQLVGRIQSQAGMPMGEEVLAEDEQIIGVYGTYDDYAIYSLGMIVWRPYQA